MNRYEWWIDYLEEEVTPTEREDMGVLLKHSKDHRAVYEGLQKTKEAIKRLDPVRAPQSPEFYNSLHCAVMSRLDEVQDEVDESNSVQRVEQDQLHRS